MFIEGKHGKHGYVDEKVNVSYENICKIARFLDLKLFTEYEHSEQLDLFYASFHKKVPTKNRLPTVIFHIDD